VLEHALEAARHVAAGARLEEPPALALHHGERQALAALEDEVARGAAAAVPQLGRDRELGQQDERGADHDRDRAAGTQDEGEHASGQRRADRRDLSRDCR
jgi:hypothetical protein